MVKGPTSQVHTFSHSQPDRHTSFCLGEGKPLAEAQGETVSEVGPEYRSASQPTPWLPATVQDVSGLEMETTRPVRSLALFCIGCVTLPL